MSQVANIDKIGNGFICSGCAVSNGAVWPKGHLATMHYGLCTCCGKHKNLANVGDWDWPDKKVRGMRD